jgi:hypothetical protein
MAGFASRASVTRSGVAFNLKASWDERSRGFRSALGFIDRVNTRTGDLKANYRFLSKSPWAQSFGPDVTLNVVRDRSGNTLDRLAFAGLTVGGARSTQLSVFKQEGSARLRAEEFVLFDENASLSRRFSQEGVGATFWSSPTGWLNLFLSASRTSSINLDPAPGEPEAPGRQTFWNASVDWRPNARFSLVATALDTRLEDDGGRAAFANRIVRLRSQLQFSKALWARIIAQADTLAASAARTALAPRRRLNFDVLVTWLRHPGTAVYVGFNDNLMDLDDVFARTRSGLARRTGAFTSDGRQFFIKASYLVR